MSTRVVGVAQGEYAVAVTIDTTRHELENQAALVELSERRRLGVKYIESTLGEEALPNAVRSAYEHTLAQWLGEWSGLMFRLRESHYDLRHANLGNHRGPVDAAVLTSAMVRMGRGAQT